MNLLFTIFIIYLCKSTQLSSFQNLVHAFNEQVYDWIAIPSFQIKQVLLECKLYQHEQLVLQMIDVAQSINEAITLQTIQSWKRTLKSTPKLQQAIHCYLSKSKYKVYFKEQKSKIRVISNFIQSFQKLTKKIFSHSYNQSQKGLALGKFFRALFQYHYVNIVSESSTLSTVFFRALTSRSSIFDHSDLSFCLSIQDVGFLSEKLENLDINTIFVKVPEIFDRLKRLKLKQKCKTQQNIAKIKLLTSKIKDIDMFRIMYEGYEPYVDISTEKYGVGKVKQLARQIADVIDKAQFIAKDQKQKPNPLKKDEDL